jgi:hypothetical protein
VTRRLTTRGAFPCRFLATFVLAMLATLGTVAADPTTRPSDLPAARPDLLPKPGRWQAYPSDVGNVAIDRNGRAWFMLRKFDSVERVQQQVEEGFDSKAPSVMGRIFLFDSTGRIWLSPRPNELMGYDPTSRQWITRQTITTVRGGQPRLTALHTLCGPAVEDSAGRLFFGEGSGCHVFDHGVWTFQPFYDRNLQKGIFEGSDAKFEPPVFAPDPSGDRLYVWTPWTYGNGTLGFWIFERGTWRQTDTDAGWMSGRISAVVPLEHHRAVICPEFSPVYIETIPAPGEPQTDRLEQDIELLAAESYADRRDAQRRLTERGPQTIPKYKEALATAVSPEIRVRLRQIIKFLEQSTAGPRVDGYQLKDVRLWGHDAKGNAVLFAEKAITPEGKSVPKSAWLISPQGDVRPAPKPITEWAPHVIFPDPHGDLYMIHHSRFGVLSGGNPVDISQQSDGIFESIDGEGADGRLYVRTRTQTFAFDPGGRDLRRALPVEAYEKVAAFCQDCDGFTVAALGGRDHALLSRFRNGQWEELPAAPALGPLPRVMYLQPLRGGGFAVRDASTGAFLLFDGTKWSRYPDFHALAENNRQWLLDAIDNKSRGLESGIQLRVDAFKNIWCVDWEKVDIFDGNKWTQWRPPPNQFLQAGHVFRCIPFLSDRQMIICNESSRVAARMEGGVLHVDPPLPMRAQMEGNDNRVEPNADSRGQIVYGDGFGAALIYDGANSRILKDVGMPRFADSLGRVWFVNARQKELIIQPPTGPKTLFSDDAISTQSTLVEARPGSYWMTTVRGLRHILQTPGNPPTLAAEGDYYEKGIPGGSILGMWIDPEHNLWIPNGPQLNRVELP